MNRPFLSLYIAFAAACARSPDPVPVTATPVAPELAQSSDSAPRWIVEAAVDYAWVPGTAPYRFVIEHPTDSTAHGVWSGRLRIVDPAGRILLIEDTLGDGGVGLEEMRTRDSTLTRHNLFVKQFVYVLPALRGPGGHPMLIVPGWGYASDPAAFWLLAVDDSGRVRKVMESVNFDLAELADLDGDDRLELIGWEVLGQSVGANAAGCEGVSYHPYSVFRLTSSAFPQAQYDSVLTAEYNRAHYIWGGEYSDTLPIVEHCPGGVIRWAPKTP